MGFWIRGSFLFNVSTPGSSDNKELFYNQSTAIGGGSPLVIVDGILTFLTDTDDLCGARLVTADEMIIDSDLTENTPEEDSDMVFYHWYVGRGPLIFRTRTKRRLSNDEKLWMTLWKELGSTNTNIQCGYQFYLVPAKGS